jgi:hypothetical protein
MPVLSIVPAAILVSRFRFVLHKSFQRFRNFLSLLLHEIGFHRIILIVLLQQLGQLNLLLEQWPLRFALTGTLRSPPLPTIVSLFVSRVRLLFLLVPNTLNLAFLFLVSRMIHTHHATHDTCSAKIIHSQVATALILILQKAETSTLARFLVADQVDVYRVSVLAENGENVALAELKWQASNVKVGRVAIVGMP